MSNAAPSTAEAPAKKQPNKSPEEKSKPTPSQLRWFAIYAVAFLIVCCAIVVAMFHAVSQINKKEPEANQAQLNGTVRNASSPSGRGERSGNSDTVASAGNAEDSAQQVSEATVVYRARLLRFQTRLQIAVQNLREIRDAGDLWEGEYTDLLTNEHGRRIASDPEAVRTFITVLDMDRPSLATTVGMLERVDNLRAPVEEALRKNGHALVNPVDELFGELDQLLLDLSPIHSSMVLQKRLTQDLVLKFANVPPAAKTLADAVQEARRETSARQIAELQAVQKAAQQEAATLILAAEKEAIAARGKADAEARRILGETESAALIDEAKLRKEKIDAGLAQRKEEQRVAELRKRASDPLVQRKYSAFLDKGLATFSYGPGNSAPGDRPLPASWSELNRNGFIKDVQTFAKSLSAQAFHTGANDRRVAAMPKTDAEWKEADRQFEEFKQLGPIWVEMGLLLP